MSTERLWTPWRMAYIRQAGRDEGCVLCDLPAAGDDPANHILGRGELVYALLNSFPYNPGHLMVVPYRHVGTLDDLTEAELLELTTLTRDAVAAIRSVSAPHGFNIGLNLGGVAGGSLSEHLHQHVVPRWSGDANFIAVTAQTKVIPQLLSETRDLIAAAWPH